MTSTQLPRPSFDDGGIRVALLPEIDSAISASFNSYYGEEDKRESYPTLSSARYYESDLPADSTLDHGREGTMSRAEKPPQSSPITQSIPSHPIPALQEAFAESLREVTGGGAVEKPKLRALDVAARREALLAQGQDDPPFDATWRLRPGQTQHEVSKLIGQISFGVYLLLKGMANSNTQVVAILQSHIDEVDEFLEITIEDIAQAEKDLRRRIEHLKLPMSNMYAFEQLLEDRAFRTEILEGNEKIEHILARTNAAMNQWDTDIDTGLKASNVFVSWLNEQRESEWRRERPEVADIFDAMNGNAEGWLLAFEKISDNTQDINNLIIRLMNIISEIEKKAGEVSRKTWAKITPFSAPPRSSIIPQATSPHSSHGSIPRSIPKSSGRSGSISAYQPGSPTDDFDETSTIEFPMPVRTTLVPPLRATPFSPVFNNDGKFRLSHPHTHQNSLSDVEDAGSDEDNAVHSPSAQPLPLAVLQPRTYTPVPPAPLPSPRVKDENTQVVPLESPRKQTQAEARNSHMKIKLQSQTFQTFQSSQAPLRKASVRERVALKTTPPEAIHIPPQSMGVTEMYAQPSSSATATMRMATSDRPGTSQGANFEYHSYQQPQPVISHDLSNPVAPNINLRSSPRQDQQRSFRPIVASPHSPLQQRPHTAAGYAHQPDHHSAPMPGPTHHLRNKPSNIGAASMLSNVTTLTYEGSTRTTRTTNPSGKQVKKKKSAFGWFKKAFSMDEEERAAFEARKAAQHQANYYNNPSPKFLDGRRLR